MIDFAIFLIMLQHMNTLLPQGLALGMIEVFLAEGG